MTHYRAPLAAAYLGMAIAFLAFTSQARAGFIDTTDSQTFVPTPTGGYWTVQGDHHDVIAFLPGPADVVLTKCCNNGFSNQSPATQEAELEALYPGLDLVLLSEGQGNGTTSFTLPGGGNVFSIHYGDDQLVFGYNDLQGPMSFGNLPHGWSNYRVFGFDENCDTTPFTTFNVEVDAPATMALLPIGLIGLALARRKRKPSK